MGKRSTLTGKKLSRKQDNIFYLLHIFSAKAIYTHTILKKVTKVALDSILKLNFPCRVFTIAFRRKKVNTWYNNNGHLAKIPSLQHSSPHSMMTTRNKDQVIILVKNVLSGKIHRKKCSEDTKLLEVLLFCKYGITQEPWKAFSIFGIVSGDMANDNWNRIHS